jgi:tagatose-1,6-bisphosphate aldolase
MSRHVDFAANYPNDGLELAAEAGVKFNGVLCGHATWKDDMPRIRQRRRARIPQMACRSGHNKWDAFRLQQLSV